MVLEKRIFYWFLLYIGMEASWSCDQGQLYKLFVPARHRCFHTKSDFNQFSGFSGDFDENVDGQEMTKDN